MNFDLIIMDGYGQFVWPAFVFTILSCCILYLKTKKEFAKQEKRFLSEFKKTQIIKIKGVKEKEALSKNLVF